MRKIFIISMLLLLPGCMTSKLIREHREARSLPIENLDFASIPDGTYSGYYEGGLCGWRENRVEVIVSGGIVREIKRLYTNDAGASDSLSEKLNTRIIDEQSLDVDAVSGASLTSRAYIKAIEIALKGEAKE